MSLGTCPWAGGQAGASEQWGEAGAELSCSPYLCGPVHGGVDVVRSLARTPFPRSFPLLLWARLQFAYKVLFVERVKQAILWAATPWLQAVTVVQSRKARLE